MFQLPAWNCVVRRGITARCLAQHVAAIAQVLERFEIGLDQGLNLDPAC